MPDFLTEPLAALASPPCRRERAGGRASGCGGLVVNRRWLGAPAWCGALENAGRRLAGDPAWPFWGGPARRRRAAGAVALVHCPTRAGPTNSAICSWQTPSPTAVRPTLRTPCGCISKAAIFSSSRPTIRCTSPARSVSGAGKTLFGHRGPACWRPRRCCAAPSRGCCKAGFHPAGRSPEDF